MSRGPLAPRGWVAAPELIAQEIRLLWQEEEMPEELKSSPGYSTFTLSPEAQAWVDGMLEVTEHQDKRGSLVIGRPKPVVQPEHRIIPAQAPVFRDVSVDMRAPDTIRERPAPPPPPRKIAPRPMPQVNPGRVVPLEPAPALSNEQPPAVPDVGPKNRESEAGGSTLPPTAPRPMPQVGVGPAVPANSHPATSIEPPHAVPEIGTERAIESETTVDAGAREEARAMPDIGMGPVREEEKAGPPVPRPMPDIG